MTIFFLILGFTSLSIAGYLHFKNKPQHIENLIIQEETVSQTNKEKGNEFEDYVIDLILSHDEMKLLSKNSDYHKNGKSAADNQTPDLKMQFNDKKFAIECKYRSQFVHGKIDWAKKYQIENYKNFEKAHQQKVYVCIGIGGTSDSPKQLYLVPLFRLSQTFATHSYLEEFLIKDNKQLIKSLKL